MRKKLIQNINFRWKHSQYQNRLFLQFLLLVTIPLVVMGIVSYRIYIEGETTKSKLALESYSENIVSELENTLTSIKEYYLDSTSSETYKWLIRQEEIPYSAYSDVKEAQNMLQGSYFISKYIHMYHFIHMREKWVINRYGMFPYDDMKNKEEFEAFLKEQNQTADFAYWQNRTEQKPLYQGGVKETETVDTSGTFLVIKNGRYEGDAAVYLLIQINMEPFWNFIQTYRELGYDISIFYDNTVFFQTNQEFTDGYLQNQKVKSYDLNINDNSSNGLVYVIGYNRDQAKAGGTRFLRAALIIILIFGLLLVGLRFIAIAFSKPFILLQNFTKVQGEHIKELFISNMVKGELNEEKIEAALDQYKIKSYQYYRMLGISCKPQAEYNQKEMLVLALNELHADIKELIFVAPVILDESLLFIVGEDDKIALDDKTALCYKYVKDFMESKFYILIATGISKLFRSLTQVRASYLECQEALYWGQNIENTINSTLVLYDDYNTADASENVYDIILEKELCDAVAVCNEEESIRLLEVVIHRINVKGILGIERNFYITRLLIAILSVPGRDSLQLGDIFKEGHYNILNQASKIYGAEELIRYIRTEIIVPIMEGIAGVEEEDSTSILSQVMRMVKESRGNITLNECAQQINYHPNYICKVLKREKDLTFTDMVNEEKLRMAKNMLLTTDMSISDISKKLYYNNVQNFIRFFKKQMGMTPAVFRNEHNQ